MTSTKKQKMMISRSIVDKVRNDLNPPGRFLEKDASGLWFEVGMRKALEKTSQALRDGAFPLRKQLSEDMSDPTFLAAVFDTNENGLADATTPATTSLCSDDKKGHRRLFSAPVFQLTPIDFDLPDSKRSKPSSPNYQEIEDLNLPFSQNSTGIHFPSPAMSLEHEFQIGSNDLIEPAISVKEQHRRNRSFGGYSVSGSNVPDMSIDNIFTLFLGPSNQQHNGQQQQQHHQHLHPDQHNTMPSESLPSNDVSELFRAPLTSPSREYLSHQGDSQQFFSALESSQIQDRNNGGQNVSSQSNFVGDMPLTHDNSVSQFLVGSAASYPLQQQQSHHSIGVDDPNAPQLFSAPALNWQSEILQRQEHLSQDHLEVTFDQNSMSIVDPLIDSQQGFLASTEPLFQDHLQVNDRQVGQNIVTADGFDAFASADVQGQQQLQQNYGVQNVDTQKHSVVDMTLAQDYSLTKRFVAPPASGDLDEENMNACIDQLFSTSTPSQIQLSSGAQNVSIQENMVLCSPQPSPSTQLIENAELYQPNITDLDSPVANFPQSFITPIPSQTVGQPKLQQRALSRPTLPSTVHTQFSNSYNENTLSGVKRHRRSNTIANGDCFSSHGCSTVMSDPSSHQREYNFDFSNTMNGTEEPLAVLTNDTQSIRVGQTADLLFHDFSQIEIPALPLQLPNSSSTKGRHRRLNTTGHLADVLLPQDWEFSLEKPAPLKTIHEEIPNILLTNEFGMMPRNEGTADSSTSGIEPHPTTSSREKSPSATSMKEFLDSIAPINATVSEPESTKSTLSSEDVCHAVAADSLDGEENMGEFFNVDDKNLIDDWHAEVENPGSNVQVWCYMHCSPMTFHEFSLTIFLRITLNQQESCTGDQNFLDCAALDLHSLGSFKFDSTELLS